MFNVLLSFVVVATADCASCEYFDGGCVVQETAMSLLQTTLAENMHEQLKSPQIEVDKSGNITTATQMKKHFNYHVIGGSSSLPSQAEAAKKTHKSNAIIEGNQERSTSPLAQTTASHSGGLQSNRHARHQSTATLLLQCELDGSMCRLEALHIALMLTFLIVSILVVISAFAFFREDKEEQITPICPQLVVKNAELNFQLPPVSSSMDRMEVTDAHGDTVCKVVMDWPDPFRPGASGVAATVRIQSQSGNTLATVVARTPAVTGQGIALCRAGCEIFGFVEADEENKRFNIRHRTGVHMLTLVGDFVEERIEGINPVGTKICSFQLNGDVINGRVMQHVDAGLILCGFLAIRTHRRLAAGGVVTTARGPAEEVLTRIQRPDEADGSPEAAAD